MYVQICRGTGATRGCGIGRWNGAAEMLFDVQNGVMYGLPVTSPFDGVLHFAVFEAGAWSLYRLEGGAAVPVPGIGFPANTAASNPAFAFNRKGDALLIETSNEQLSLVSYGTGAATPWGPGYAPLWFVAKGRPADAQLVPTPRAVAYSTPAPTTPTPVPTATVSIPNSQPMTLLLTVKRNNVPVSGVRVVATVGNGTECATAITSTGVTTMQFPQTGAPAACRQPGVTIRFVVADVQLATPTATYTPQSLLPFELNLPN
jgi:hypothetical protein